MSAKSCNRQQKQAEFSDIFFAVVLRVKAYLCCLTQFTVDQSKLTVNDSVLSDTPNVRYLVALYTVDEGKGVRAVFCDIRKAFD